MRDRGFTLIEMIITVAIAGILGLFTFSFLSNLSGTYATMETQTEVYQQGNYALERISRELRDAQPWVDSSGATHFLITENGTYTFMLSHATPADSGYMFVQYGTDGNRLYRASGPASRTLATNVKSFTVSSETPGATPVLTLTLTLGAGGQMQTFSTRVTPKNYSSPAGGCCYTNSATVDDYTQKKVTCYGGYGGCYEDRIF